MPDIDVRLLSHRLAREVRGDVYFDRFQRGRYSTDASIYQIVPLGVAVPRDLEDLHRIISIAGAFGVSITPRGAGSSQGGQAIGPGLVVDCSRHLTGVLDLDLDRRTVTVQPGVVLDELNAALRQHDLFFPVDVATSNRATIGGMTGNNSAGARSIRYGIMADNVVAVEALLADGSGVRLGPGEEGDPSPLIGQLEALYDREREELNRRVPQVLRHVAGYNLHRLGGDAPNPASILVGSEGTLGLFSAITLRLAEIPPVRALGVCHFPRLHDAMEAVQHIVTLEPTAVELVDETLIDLARQNVSFEPIVRRFLHGTPGALLLVEFAGTDGYPVSQLHALEALLRDHGCDGPVVRAEDAAFQQQIWSVRKAGLNIVMSMRGQRKPVSFIEDCAVPLEHLAEYTDRLTDIFARHGTTGTFYAHASVGCLHVRPALNLKLQVDVKKMRAIAEEAMAAVREFKGSHSGEHGDGLVRSEFLRPMLGDRLVRAFDEVKTTFDPRGMFNPGKIVHPPAMDDRSLFRYPPGYTVTDPGGAFDWSAWEGWGGAVEMCNNNGACRKTADGTMCPSFRATRDEVHSTRGRANTLRLALSGQLGPDALSSPAMFDTMELCIGCKACRRECPTGVDMARMKTEFLGHYRARHGVPLGTRLVASLPRLAPVASRLAPIVNRVVRPTPLARLAERLTGLSARRRLPMWRSDAFREPAPRSTAGPEVVLWVDTFNRYFEPDTVWAAHAVLEAAGFSVTFPAPINGRPACCGRTFLSAGLLDEAREEMARTMEVLLPFARRGIPIVGLEPSCLLTARDEFVALAGGADTDLLAKHTFLVEEFLVGGEGIGRLGPRLKPLPVERALVHGHCHQKAFGLEGTVARLLGAIPSLQVDTIRSGCCGMAGSFGYEADHVDLSLKMAELDLLPAVRAAGPDTWIVADGTSCRTQIVDGTGIGARHAADVLRAALP